MWQKVKSLGRYWRDPRVSKAFLLKYAIGQILAYVGIGKYISFSTPHYRLYLTKSPIAVVMFGNPHYVRDEEDVLEKILSVGDVAVDVGANIGTFALRAAKLTGPSGHVFAFEGNPETAKVMKRNVELNDFPNVTVETYAVGEQNGQTTFSSNLNDDVNHVVKVGEGITVPMIKLDDYPGLKEVEKIKIINIDVEGYEFFALRGGEHTLLKTEQVIFEAYEANCRRFGYSLSDLFDWFTEHGFIMRDLITREKIDPTTTGRSEVRNILAIRS